MDTSHSLTQSLIKYPSGSGYATVVFQGRYVHAKVSRTADKKINPVVAKRGAIKEFSRKSRKRMLDLTAKLKTDMVIRFCTLTYSDDTIPENSEQLQKHLAALFERLRRANKKTSALWRIEVVPRKSGRFQGAEVPHVHLLVFNAAWENPDPENPNYSGFLNEAWNEIIGSEGETVRTDDKVLNGDRAVMYYVAKYAAKVGGGSSPLVPSPYSHAGRYWGVHNRKALPLFDEVFLTVGIKNKAFFDFRRTAKRFFDGIPVNRRFQGFTLYSDDAYKWLNVLEAYMKI